jgi:hypothetical protein
MTKTEIIKRVNESSADEALKKMVISYINLAYSIGFEDGMKAATQTQSAVFDMLHTVRPNGIIPNHAERDGRIGAL